MLYCNPELHPGYVLAMSKVKTVMISQEHKEIQEACSHVGIHVHIATHINTDRS